MPVADNMKFDRPASLSPCGRSEAGELVPHFNTLSSPSLIQNTKEKAKGSKLNPKDWARETAKAIGPNKVPNAMPEYAFAWESRKRFPEPIYD